MSGSDQEFYYEASTQIERLSDGFVELQRDGFDRATLDDLFRQAHTLKGNCSAEGFTEPSATANALEDLLDGLRSQPDAFDPQYVDTALEALDVLERQLTDLQLEGTVETDAETVISEIRELVPDAATTATETSDSDDTPSLDSIDVPAADGDVSVEEALDNASVFDDLEGLESSVDGDGVGDVEGIGLFDDDASDDNPDSVTSSTRRDSKAVPGEDSYADMVADTDTADPDDLQSELDDVTFGEFDDDDDISIGELVDIAEDADTGDADSGDVKQSNAVGETTGGDAESINTSSASTAEADALDSGGFEFGVDTDDSAETQPAAETEPDPTDPGDSSAADATATAGLSDQPSDISDLVESPAPSESTDSSEPSDPSVSAIVERIEKIDDETDVSAETADTNGSVETADGTPEDEISAILDSEDDGHTESDDDDSSGEIEPADNDSNIAFESAEDNSPTIEPADNDSSAVFDSEDEISAAFKSEDDTSAAVENGSVDTHSGDPEPESPDVLPSDLSNVETLLAETEFDDIEDVEFARAELAEKVGFEADSSTGAFVSEFADDFGGNATRFETDDRSIVFDAGTTIPPSVLGVDATESTDSSRSTDTVREVTLDVEEADSLLELTEELVVTTQRLTGAVDDLPAEAADALSSLRDVSNRIENHVTSVRLVPLEAALSGLSRTTRRVARSQDKQVTFLTENESIEVDRRIVDELNDPLVHLVRNAVDHGIEGPDERSANGKPEEGTVLVRAERDGETVTIAIEDDGRGIDPDELRAAAVDAGIYSPAEAAALSRDEALKLMFHAGLSTTDDVTEVSGRGVGMDVVSDTVTRLEGTIDVESEPGVGTTIELTLPVSVALSDIILVTVGGQRFGFPAPDVRRVEELVPERVDGDEYRLLTGEDEFERVPIIDLEQKLDIDDAPRSVSERSDVLVLTTEPERRVIRCHDIIDWQSVVLQPFDGVLQDLDIARGAALVDSGEPVVVLETAELGGDS